MPGTDVLRMTAVGLRPNDIFKRPGPHHAFEVDLEALAKLRDALDPLEELGLSEPLAMVTGCAVDEIVNGNIFGELGFYCLAFPSDFGDFGLETYGPMLHHAGLQIHWGEPLFRERDPRVDAISPFWAERQPYLPGWVAAAADVLPSLEKLRNPPALAWETLQSYMNDDDDLDEGRAAEAAEEEARQHSLLIATWRLAYVKELDQFVECVAKIAKRGGSIVGWENEQGWL